MRQAAHSHGGDGDARSDEADAPPLGERRLPEAGTHRRRAVKIQKKGRAADSTTVIAGGGIISTTSFSSTPAAAAQRRVRPHDTAATSIKSSTGDRTALPGLGFRQGTNREVIDILAIT